MTRFRFTAVVVVAAAALAGAGCQTLFPAWVPAPDLPEPPTWVSSEPFQCFDFDGLWERCKIQATRSGYRIDDDATSYTSRRVVTTWKLDLSTGHNSGRRHRRFVSVEEVPETKDHFRVLVCTVVQRNEDTEDPLNPVSAQWRPWEPDLQDAERVAYTIAMGYRESGPSPEFEAR